MIRKLAFVFCAVLMPLAAVAAERVVWMDGLDLSPIKQGWGKPVAGRSVQGKTMRLGGKSYDHGVGTHAPATIYVVLDGKGKRFQAMLGVDDEVGNKGSVSFKIYGNDNLLHESPVMRGGDAPTPLDIDISGITMLSIAIGEDGDANSFDHADLAEGGRAIGDDAAGAGYAAQVAAEGSGVAADHLFPELSGLVEQSLHCLLLLPGRPAGLRDRWT